jgi:glycosyltransferase involved in cell wall biosynthesis
MQISVIIPTYNRVKELEEALGCILTQIKLPKEVIVVDDSDDDKTEELAMKMKNDFIEKNISLLYIRNKKDKSSSIARNIGVHYSKGISFYF